LFDEKSDLRTIQQPSYWMMLKYLKIKKLSHIVFIESTASTQKFEEILASKLQDLIDDNDDDEIFQSKKIESSCLHQINCQYPEI
ncbi:MAG: hypothetical protein MHMPM18_003298, partial [Marteilia pararefringens]